MADETNIVAGAAGSEAAPEGGEREGRLARVGLLQLSGAPRLQEIFVAIAENPAKVARGVGEEEDVRPDSAARRRCGLGVTLSGGNGRRRIGRRQRIASWRLRRSAWR